MATSMSDPTDDLEIGSKSHGNKNFIIGYGDSNDPIQLNLNQAWDYLFLAKWINYVLGIGYIGLGIWGIIVAKDNQTDDCFSDSNLTGFNLYKSLIGFSSLFIIFGIFQCIITKVKFSGGDVNYQISVIFAALFVIWMILFAVTLFNSTCKADNPGLYRTSLILFIYWFVACTAASLILCLCAIITEDNLPEHRRQNSNIPLAVI